MKIHCEGYTGWWAECPEPVAAQIGMFTPEQTQLFVSVGIAFVVVMFVLLLMVFVATLPDR